MDFLLSDVFWIGLMAAAVRLATPILLASLGEMLAERAGVLNIGVEGMMLIGALGGFLGSQGTGSPWVGVLSGMIAGLLLALLFAYLTITLAADQIVAGIMVNLLAIGVTGSATGDLRNDHGHSERAAVGRLAYPVAGGHPVLGPVLFQQNPLVYLGFLLVAACWFMLFRHHLGLKIRAVGEHPLAAASLGVSVHRVRYAAVLACGGMAGIGGSFLSLGQLNMFVEEMSAGRGFIALAVVIFARWHPVGVLGVSILFGAAEALQFRLQAQAAEEIPFQFLAILPYLLTVIALVSIVRRSVQRPR